jgi:hypothetical protein
MTPGLWTTLDRSLFPCPFSGTNPTDDAISSGLAVIRSLTSIEYHKAAS